jgi:hypothetical protein
MHTQNALSTVFFSWKKRLQQKTQTEHSFCEAGEVERKKASPLSFRRKSPASLSLSFNHFFPISTQSEPSPHLRQGPSSPPARVTLAPPAAELAPRRGPRSPPSPSRCAPSPGGRACLCPGGPHPAYAPTSAASPCGRTPPRRRRALPRRCSLSSALLPLKPNGHGHRYATQIMPLLEKQVFGYATLSLCVTHMIE